MLFLNALEDGTIKTRSSTVAKRPCDCSMGQDWLKYNWKRMFWMETYRSIFNHSNIIGILIY